jgi:hypothetical protein
MIDIISHFFILYPLFTFIKDQSSITKSILVKFAINMGILFIALIFTNIYLMDSNLNMSSLRTQNLYEVMDMTPQQFLEIN